MGCSSVALSDESPDAQFDASGPAMSYIIAGCPALVGNLWTVTTMDLDGETESILGWIDGSSDASLLSVLPAARNKCRLRFINGASLVYFGVPLFKKTQKVEPPAARVPLKKSSAAKKSAAKK